MSISLEAAETIGLQALEWLVGNEDLLPVFLGSTGASQGDLQTRVHDAAFLGGVLDFVMLDDAWVISFCDSVFLPYEQLMKARHALPGGENMEWT